ncbi:MAG: hypothetical protein HQK61_05425 [Desulfamplus sp.]|nr:hypothetical protein [Desulfamplus sp.]
MCSSRNVNKQSWSNYGHPRIMRIRMHFHGNTSRLAAIFAGLKFLGNKIIIIPGQLPLAVAVISFALAVMLCSEFFESQSAIAGEAEIRTPGSEIGIRASRADIRTPIADFKDPEFVFKPVPDGTRVVHDFIVKNIGNDFLLIRKVKTD